MSHRAHRIRRISAAAIHGFIPQNQSYSVSVGQRSPPDLFNQPKYGYAGRLTIILRTGRSPGEVRMSLNSHSLPVTPRVHRLAHHKKPRTSLEIARRTTKTTPTPACKQRPRVQRYVKKQQEQQPRIAIGEHATCTCIFLSK